MKRESKSRYSLAGVREEFFFSRKEFSKVIESQRKYFSSRSFGSRGTRYYAFLPVIFATSAAFVDVSFVSRAFSPKIFIARGWDGKAWTGS